MSKQKRSGKVSVERNRQRFFNQLIDEEKNVTGEQIALKRISEWIKNSDAKKDDNFDHLKTKFGQKTRILDLNGLALKNVPEQIKDLNSIENIDLGNNEISSIPDWLFTLKNLKGLNLESNDIRALPEGIESLKNLRVIWLTNNNLKTLPTALQKLPLQEILLEGNDSLQIPKSVSKRPAAEVLRYYFEARRKKSNPLLELKLLLVGRGKAGKTTLVKQLAGEQPDINEPESHSISIKELELNCPKGVVRTRAWDFGGQEILHSTHQFFLTERSLYILVLEPRTGNAARDVEYWLKLIETQGDSSPVVIALNYSKENKWRIDEVKLKRKFPFIVDVIATDALYGEGILDLRKTLIKTVQEEMPDVWLPFPPHWRAIKDEVASMKGNFLTYNEFTELCDEHGEKRPDAQADLAGILHALGLALYYGNDPRLHDTRVLNPGWVTGGVYAVIRSEYVKGKDGQLALRDMPKVLKEAESKNIIKLSDYPNNTHQFILELMKAFQLSYASEVETGKPSRYLVPELLPEFEPEMEEKWDTAPIRLRYRYEILPPGLVPRFIVQTHALSENAPHWRHGVVLNHANAKALIRDETELKEVHVYIAEGDKETRQVLAAIVRRELEILHNEMKLLPIEELALSGEDDQWVGVEGLKDVEKPEEPSQKIIVQPGGSAEVNISNELNKIIPIEARAIDRKEIEEPPPVRLFVCYAREDERKLKRLDAMLDILEIQHGLSSWDDKRLIAGEEWDEEIKSRLEGMDIFLFVASQFSLVSKYIRDIELKRAYERKGAKEIELLIVKLEPCALDGDPLLKKLQRLAARHKSVDETKPPSKVWEQIRKDLLPVIQRVREKKLFKIKSFSQ